MSTKIREETDCLANHISNSAELQEYLKLKGKNHKYYKLYSSIGRIVDIRDRECLYLGIGRKWNDVVDRENFNSDRYKFVNFGRCFSFSQYESVAMWMLYGGIDKLSGMIDFTNKGMQSILDTPKVEVGYFSNEHFFKVKTINRPLYELYCTDVIYYSKNEHEFYTIRRSEESYGSLNKDVFNNLIGCKKALPWQYENECRLICRIDRKLLEENCDTVRIELAGMDLGKSFKRVYHGPNYPSNDAKNTLPSKLDNSIDWLLCDRHCELKKD